MTTPKQRTEAEEQSRRLSYQRAVEQSGSMMFGKTPEPVTKGRIGVYTTVWCACGHWCNLSAHNVAAAAKEAVSIGWVDDPKRGWLCWHCQCKMDDDECARRCG